MTRSCDRTTVAGKQAILALRPIVLPFTRTLMVLLALAWTSPGAHAATIVVAAGAVEVNPGDGICSLREAISNANTDGDTSGGDCVAGSGADTIVLAPGAVYSLDEVDNLTDGPNGLPSITSTITINGNAAIIDAATISVMSPDGSRVFHVAASGELTLNELTVSRGFFDIEDGRPGGSGGGILNRGTLRLNSSTVTENEGLDGGGIWNDGTLELTNSTISLNSAADWGAGIYNAEGGSVTLLNSTVSGNFGEDIQGAGIYNEGTLELTDSAVLENTIFDGSGAGIYNSGGTVTLTRSLVSGNGITGGPPTPIAGGGILNNRGTLTVVNSTLSGNFIREVGAEAEGGGIYSGGTLTIVGSTITDNESQGNEAQGGGIYIAGGNARIKSTIIAGNEALGGEFTGDADCAGAAFTSFGFNLVGNGTGCPSGGPNDFTVDPTVVFTSVLGPLADNGGPTLTHALLEGSPAIDAGSCTDIENDPLLTDQRGEPRPSDVPEVTNVNGGCDIGAFEFQVAPVEDLTPPECEIVALHAGPPKNLDIGIEDGESGVASLTVVKALNATVEIPKGSGTFFSGGDLVSFVPPEVMPLVVNAAKIDPSGSSTVVLEVTDAAGNITTCDPVETTETAEIPERFGLDQNFPNPFLRETTIPFSLVEPTPVLLEVYDVTGKRVAVLIDQTMEAGTYEARWDGISDAGVLVSNGVYLYRIRAGEYEETRAMLLLK